jgi:probable O-glycosylation ligase (exosortase A-associated)
MANQRRSEWSEAESSKLDAFRERQPPSEQHALDHEVLSRYFVKWRALFVMLLIVAFSLIASYLLLRHDARYAVGAVGVLGMGVLIFIKPQVGFWAYYIMAFARPHEVIWGFQKLRISMGLAVFTLVATLIRMASAHRSILLKDRILGVMLAFNVTVAISAIVNDGSYERLTDMTKMLLFAGVFAVFVNRRSWSKATFWLLTLCFAYLTIWAMLQKFVHGVYMLEGPGTRDATLKDRNFFAMHLLLGIPFYWYLAQRLHSKIFKLAAWGMIPLAVLGVFLTASRGGLLGVATAMGVISWQSRHRWPALITGLCLLAGFYVVAAPNTLKGRATTIVHYEGEASAEGRLHSWRAGTKMMLANPLFGVGPAQYVRSYRFYDRSRPRQAHNTLVQTGGEYGVTGLLFLIAFHVLVFRRLVRLRRLARSRGDRDLNSWTKTLIASLMAFWVSGFFISAERYEFIWFLGALTVALTQMSQQEKVAEEEMQEQPA